MREIYVDRDRQREIERARERMREKQGERHTQTHDPNVLVHVGRLLGLLLATTKAKYLF